METVIFSRKCDVRIESRGLSRVHASISLDRDSGGYYVIDEHSRNGTWVEGEKIGAGVPTALTSGTWISFGDDVFIFLAPDVLSRLVKRAV